MEQEGRLRKTVINIINNVFNQFTAIILSFISRTVFIRYLGIEYLGLNSVFSDVLNLLSMADLGFGIAMVYSFYRPLAQKDKAKISALINFYRKIYTLIACIIAVAGTALIPVIPRIIKLDYAVPNLKIYYIISLINVVVSYLFIYKTSVLTADQNNYIIAQITMVCNLIKTVIQIICIVLFHNYIIYLIIGVIFSIINNIISSVTAEKKYPYIKDQIELDYNSKKEIYKNLFSVFLYKVSNVLLNATDNILISSIVGTVALGYYSNYFMVQTKVLLFYSLIFTSMTASIGNLVIKEQPEKRYNVFLCGQSIAYIACVIVVPCFASLINDLILVWLGKEFILTDRVIFAMGSNMFLSCVLQPLWSYREATGLYQKTKWIMAICALINLVLSFILGRISGISGIILASVISRLVTYVWYEPKLLFKEYFCKNVFLYYRNLLYNLIIVFGLSLILFIINKYMLVSNWFMLLAKSCLYFMVCLLVGLAFYHKSEGVKMIKRKLFG